MFIFLLALVMLFALALSFSKNGIGSFVTLGVFGAAVYTIPALVNTQRSLSTFGIRSSNIGMVSVPDDVMLVVFLAWIALLSGLIVCVLFVPSVDKRIAKRQIDTSLMGSIAMACATLGMLGFIYIAYSQESVLFFLQDRTVQESGAVALLWRWTAPLGLISASFARNRRLLLLNGLILIVIFMRGDRTMVAIATAALVAVESYKRIDWWKRLQLSQIAGIGFAAAVIFFGKTIYVTVKASATGQASSIKGYSAFQLFTFQFEPFSTFSQLEFVMRTGITIPMSQFVESVVGNFLIVPSAFGISTNIYNEYVTSHLSANYTAGVAGNYMAHGYAVGGTIGAMLFYFMLPVLLRICDGQLRSKTGSVKVFWACIGAVLAFYIHRNGVDNLFSFVRQAFIASVAMAGVAAAFRQFGFAKAFESPNSMASVVASQRVHARRSDPDISVTQNR